MKFEIQLFSKGEGGGEIYELREEQRKKEETRLSKMSDGRI